MLNVTAAAEQATHAIRKLKPTNSAAALEKAEGSLPEPLLTDQVCFSNKAPVKKSEFQVKDDGEGDFSLHKEGQETGYIFTKSQAELTPATDFYQGKPYLTLKGIGVDDDFMGQGISKHLTQLAVEISYQKGYEGRVGLKALPEFGSPAAIIHGKNGFKFYEKSIIGLSEAAAQEKQRNQLDLEALLMDRSKVYTAEEGPKGYMFLPESKIQEYLTKPRLYQTD